MEQSLARDAGLCILILLHSLAWSGPEHLPWIHHCPLRLPKHEYCYSCTLIVSLCAQNLSTHEIPVNYLFACSCIVINPPRHACTSGKASPSVVIVICLFSDCLWTQKLTARLGFNDIMSKMREPWKTVFPSCAWVFLARLTTHQIMCFVLTANIYMQSPNTLTC